MAKPNYQFEKRQRELEKKRKKEDKRQQVLAAKAPAEGEGSPDALEQPAATDAAGPGTTSES
ncbi:hypothetical protein [Accumulibacter sp.]|uniref:hypothetical protein n=1 Tax=Accumulibacter sp. TaxID=2053492 RepID=UPI0028C4097B|nr:hypothetical protein [Accumulibacter sp.]